ncbi:MAG: YdcF family protein [Candidatus Peribacteraceae bacterium]|nr:YdcF family protein [Candidatus Peribacteraceae bacterium]
MTLKILHTVRRLCLFIGLPIAIFYASTVLFVYQRMDGNGVSTADCAIVFGAAVRPVFNDDGKITAYTAGPGIARRVATAAELFEQGRIHRLFFSGGRGVGNTKSEAQVMKEYAVSLGIPSERITLEEDSSSTWENLLYTRPLTYDCHGVLAISDAYHLARIRMIAHIQGWELPTYPAEPRPQMLFIARSLLREAIGVDLLVLMQLLT